MITDQESPANVPQKARALRWAIASGALLLFGFTIQQSGSSGGALFLTGLSLAGGLSLLFSSLSASRHDADHNDALLESSAEGTAQQRRREILRSIKDLEHERSIGRLNETDFERLTGELRGEAKTLMRSAEAQLGPYRAEAEALVERHLRERGLLSPTDGRAQDTVNVAEGKKACTKCSAANDLDARFCKACGSSIP